MTTDNPTARMAYACRVEGHPDRAHHHVGSGANVHRHPGCPWDCPEKVYQKPVVIQEEMVPESPEAASLETQDAEAIDGATSALAGIMGHLAGHFSGRADLARQDLEAVSLERDTAVRLLKSMISILDGMAYAPTFAANGRDWEEAQDFLEAIARTDREG